MKTVYDKSLSKNPHLDDKKKKFVCLECIHDKYLKKIIQNHLESYECSYCKSKSKKLIAASLQHLVWPIYQGMRTEWVHPEEVLSYSTAEGGYLGADVYATYDLSWFIQKEADITNMELVDDIIGELNDYYWCEDPGSPNLPEELKISWERFCNAIKHRYRYTFFEIDEKNYFEPESSHYDIGISPQRFLKILSQIIKKDRTKITKIYKGTRIFRARMVSNENVSMKAQDIGTPPKECAKTSRMSPAGIPIFYGARDRETALQEVLVRKNSEYKYAAIAEFETLIDLEVLNLHHTHHEISVFDIKKSRERKVKKFLEQFANEISKDIILDGREHIDYVPTQVLTEYFRYVFKYKKTRYLNGITYKSTRNRDGTNCALFVESDQCIDTMTANEHKNPILKLVGVEQRSI